MISEEAVEVAADLVLRMIMEKPLTSANPVERELALRQGRLILEAAAPYMRTTVTTPAELANLPIGSVVLSETYGTPKRPSALQKTPGALWIPIGRSGDTHSRWILPATVLHVGPAK